MPQRPSARQTPPSPQRGLSRSLVGMAILAFVGLYMLADIPEQIGRWKMAAAEKLYREQKFDLALDVAADAQSWAPHNVQFARKRINWLQQHGDLDEALAELDALLESVQGNDQQRSVVFVQRADLLQTMGRHEDALDDANKAFELLGVAASPHADGPYSPDAVNTRAYFVARARAANKASDKQAGEAVAQMRELIELWDVNLDALASRSASPAATMDFRMREIMYLDTYAYLRIFTGEPQAALYDLNRCVEMCDHLIALAESESTELGRSAEMKAYVRQLYDHKAVIIFHRGVAYKVLGNDASANADFRTGLELGYNPKTGMW